ncbi:dihydrofolate reductase [Acarospora aff. strigata]|nr:dihydrofolate reductase [Acarospora aff. strigata]
MLIQPTTTAIPPQPPTPTLTLIVAATSTKMGIGLNGTLPWAPLKKEMAHGARITKPAPPPPPSSSFSPPTSRSSSSSTNSKTQEEIRPINAVIMDRKTWQSIPPKFRPLNLASTSL